MATVPSFLTGSNLVGSGTSSNLSTVSLAPLSAVFQQGFNSTQIGWHSINWSLLHSIAPHPNPVPDYVLTHNLDSVSVFVSISAVTPPVFLELLDDAGEPVKDEEGNPVYALDDYGNPIRIVDSANDLFLAIGGTDGSDHLRNRDYSFPDGGGETRQITGAFMGFAGDDVLYSENVYTPMLIGGSGDDTYVLENTGSQFTQIVEYGGDDDDTVVTYANDWTIAGDIDGQHLFLANSTQTDVVIFWDYKAADAKIEHFWFDFDKNGLNEHYSYEEFIATLQASKIWLGSIQAEALGIARQTMSDLTRTITEAITLSDQIESFRIADYDTVLSIARLYQAAFDRSPDVDGLNYWIDRWESEQLSIGRIADDFVASSEFVATYGNLNNGEYVTQLYSNVLDRSPDQGGFDYWVGRIDDGVSRADIMSSFSDSLENKVNTEVQLSGLVESIPGEWIL